MSKRLISFGLILIVGIMTCSMLFAATNFSESGKVSDLPVELSLNVKWNYSTEDLYEVGFSSTEVTKEKDPTNVVVDTDGVYAMTNTGETASSSSGTGSVYVYWKISSYNGFEVSLKANGPMMKAGATDSTKKLDWQARWFSQNNNGDSPVEQISGSLDNTLNSRNYSDFLPVYTQTKDEAKTGAKTKIGSTLVTMTTANAMEDTGEDSSQPREEGLYSSSLKLQITMKD